MIFHYIVIERLVLEGHSQSCFIKFPLPAVGVKDWFYRNILATMLSSSDVRFSLLVHIHTHIYFLSLSFSLMHTYNTHTHTHTHSCTFLYVYFLCIMIEGRRKNKNMQQLLPVSPCCHPTIIINKRDTYRNVRDVVAQWLEYSPSTPMRQVRFPVRVRIRPLVVLLSTQQ